MDPRSESKSSWLSALLAPVSADEFLSRHWLKQHLLCHGSAHRFSGLLSWTSLNEILARHWREPQRFRLACRGHNLDPASYADVGGSNPRIRANDVTDQLRRGATLSFDAIDELHEPLTRLSESFEAFFRAGTQINVYAAFRAVHGLDLHRDDQEIFILQLDGRKRWLLYGFSVDGVNRNELSSSSVPPAGALLDQILQPGDLLYIPRGCYHLAVPMNEPALHLTLGVKNPQGMDLVEQGFSESSSNFKSRPTFSLPWSATTELLPPSGDFLITLHILARLVDDNPEAGSIQLHYAGRRFRFPQSMQWIIEPLEDGTPVPISRLIETVAGRLDAGIVRLLVGMLLKHGLIAIRV
jgi:ribosomal protein L16 Arg81 hydroxylase